MMLLAGIGVAFIAIMGIALSAAIFYHFMKFGVQGDRSRTLAIVFGAGTALWIVLILGAYLAVDWNSLVTLGLPELPGGITP